LNISTLIGQTAKSVMIDLPLTAHVVQFGNKTPLPISEFQLWRLPLCLIHSRAFPYQLSRTSPHPFEVHANWIYSTENRVFSTYQQQFQASATTTVFGRLK